MNKRTVLKKIFSLLKGSRLLLTGVLLSSVVYVAATLAVPVFAGRAIDAAVGVGMLDTAALRSNLLGAALCSLIGGVTQWLMSICSNGITFRTVRNIRNLAFDSLTEKPIPFIDSTAAGESVNHIISEADTMADGLLMGFSQLFTGILTIIGTLVLMFLMNPAVALVVVCLTPVSLFAAKFIASRTYSMFKEQTAARAAETAFINEMTAGREVVRAFSMEDVNEQRFDELNEALRSSSLRATFFSSITNPTTRFVNSLVYAGAGLTGALAVLGGGMTVGSLSAVLSYANRYTKPFNEISGVIAELQNALACASRIFEFIEVPSRKPDAESAVDMQEVRGAVDFRDVCFSYTADRELIKGFSLHVEPGMKVAVVGPTGCGKTTLINLIMRFYTPVSGSIEIDGVDTRNITRSSLRRNIGFVLQDTWLRKGTIRENIALGHPGATDEEIVQAARNAHAHSFIKRLPQGYDTVIGEDGGGLSAGQKQLLCAARVMLRVPPILILDEATSSIDTRTEQLVQSAFDRLTAGRTSFVVAHRLSTIVSADVIIVMKDGHIIEQGTHSELLARDGFYAELWEKGNSGTGFAR